MAHDPLLFTEVEADVLEEFVVPPSTIALDGLAKFRWTKDYLHIRVVDPANTITVEQKVTPEVFETYDIDVSNENEIVTGVDCDLLLDFIKKASKDEIVEFKSSIDKLHIGFGHMSGEFASIDTDTIREPEEKEFTHSIEATVPKSVFTESKDISSLLGPRIELSVSADQFDITCSKDDSTIDLEYDVVSDKSDLDQNEPNVFIDKVESEAKATFSRDIYQYLADFVPEGYFNVKADSSSPLVVQCNRADNRIPTKIALGQRVDSR